MNQARDAAIIAPIRYAAWLGGELGKNLEAALKTELCDLAHLDIKPLPRAFLIAADEAPGVLLERTAHALTRVEETTRRQYPIFHREMGPVFANTLQAVFTKGGRAA